MKKQIIIVGGGASGMIAAIAAARRLKKGEDILLLEKNEQQGRKLLATGNGRCNFTNLDCNPSDFLSQQETPEAKEFVRMALMLFPPQKTLSFFAGIGILARIEEEGRVYPYSGQGSVVQEALVRRMREMNISVRCGRTVKEVKKEKDGFSLLVQKEGTKDRPELEIEEYTCKQLILAAGGKAGLQFGSTGDGYRLAAALGHTVVKPIPALVPLRCGEDYTGAKGVRARGKVTLCLEDEELASDEGEIQFTEDGVSGICVFNISRYMQMKNGSFPKGYHIVIDLFPELTRQEVLSMLERGRIIVGHLPMVELLKGIVHEKLAEILCQKAGLPREMKMKQLGNEKLLLLSELLKNWKIQVVGTRSWKDAQVTCGGVSCAELTAETMESRLVPNLYITGEMVDVDGRCGGFNLQWAWCSGYLAGRCAGEKKEKNA